MALAAIDFTKLFLSLVAMSFCQHLTLWFFIIYADGLMIFLLTKLRDQLYFERTKGVDHGPEERVTVSKNKMIGLLLLALSNSLMSFFLSPSSLVFVYGYMALSCVEHYLLESGTNKKEMNKAVIRYFGSEVPELAHNALDGELEEE